VNNCRNLFLLGESTANTHLTVFEPCSRSVENSFCFLLLKKESHEVKRSCINHAPLPVPYCDEAEDHGLTILTGEVIGIGEVIFFWSDQLIW
jgi:hypothetical protein